MKYCIPIIILISLLLTFILPVLATSSLSEISDSPLTPLPQESFKFKLKIKDNNDTSSQPSSLIAIENKPSDIFEFKEKICESLDEKYGLLNYEKFKMIYKAENRHGLEIG